MFSAVTVENLLSQMAPEPKVSGLYACIRFCVCMCVPMCVRVHTHVCTCMYLCVCMHVSVCVLVLQRERTGCFLLNSQSGHHHRLQCVFVSLPLLGTSPAPFCSLTPSSLLSSSPLPSLPLFSSLPLQWFIFIVHWIWSHLGDTALGMSVRKLIERSN